MLSVRVDLGPLVRILNGFRNPDLRAAFREARKPMRGDLKEHRQRQEGPDGTWPKLAASTKQRRAAGRKRKRARRLLGRLPTSLIMKSDRRRLLITSRVPWAQAHRTGARVGHGTKLPVRDWLYASVLALQAVAYIIERHLQEQYGKAR